MKNKFLLLLLILVSIVSCKKEDDNVIIPESELTERQLTIIDYFKDIVLGFEFGGASKITRKWNRELKIFVGGEPNAELMEELEKITMEINDLATDNFKVSIVSDSVRSNYYIFFGSGTEYAKIYPSQSNLITSNLALFWLFWNNRNQFTSGHMYVDVTKADPTAQKHLLREELTQSLGLARDSPKYLESIFQLEWTTTTEYTSLDKDLIRLLYHPDMSIGLNEAQVDAVLKSILSNE